eukprot:CAMPEP_0115335070 /NCGR_PEP_ID=MMETSP0270-20121206/88243_1 /TAXON_ID=71861 /ORGANISM="Scrippsiella trochoidea, Strain CCMP3099" /LENGTH=79 /DNA_ID=CAMNT_0002756085 /DNA_START=73 /DNA_END=312 /DNA_ORIENTATION=-
MNGGANRIHTQSLLVLNLPTQAWVDVHVPIPNQTNWANEGHDRRKEEEREEDCEAHCAKKKDAKADEECYLARNEAEAG